MQSAKTRPGADYGSEHELLIAKFRLKLKKVQKTSRPKSNLLQLYSGSDKQIQVIGSDKVPEEIWIETCNIAQEAVIKIIPKIKKCKKAKWLSEEGLQIAVKKRRRKSKREKERYTHEMQSSKEEQREIRKPSSAIKTKK